MCLVLKVVLLLDHAWSTMAEKKEAKVTANLTQESIKVVSESIGVVGLPDEAAARLAVDVTYKLKHLIQVRQRSSVRRTHEHLFCHAIILEVNSFA